MSRVFHYGVATAVGTLLGGAAHAQDLQPVPGTTVTELDPLVITGVPSAREAEDLPPGVDVIGGGGETPPPVGIAGRVHRSTGRCGHNQHRLERR